MGFRSRLASWIAPPTAAAPVDLPPAGAVREASTTDNNDDVNGFRRMGLASKNTPYLRDLFPGLHDKMLRVAPKQWHTNPLSRWLIETTVDFVLGEGVTIECEVDEVRAVIDAFWNDPVNRLEQRLDGFIRDLGIYGEQCYPVAVNGIDGHVRMSTIDPLDIETVLTDPDNALITTSVVLKGQGRDKQILKVIREETARASSYYGRLMPALPGEREPTLQRPYTGSCYLYQINRLSTGKRGVSDLIADLDWLDAYDGFLFDSMDNAIHFNTFVWDATLEGFTEAQIKDWLDKFGKDIGRTRGAAFAHNEKVKLEPRSPNVNAPDKAEFALMYRGQIIGSHSFPVHWYGTSDGSNVGAAKEMGLPAVKRLTRRQKEVRQFLTEMIRFPIHQAIIAGTLAPTCVVGKVDKSGSSKGRTIPADQAFKVLLPELSMKDQSAIVAATTSLVAALIQAEQQGYVRKETAAKIFAMQVSQLGLPLDAEDEWDPAAGTASADYQNGQPNLQQMLARLQAQVGRQGNGDGENINEPKKTTPVGGNGPS